MIWWEGDNLTTPDYSTFSANINSGAFIFRDWTNYLSSSTDLFYANGTISFSPILIDNIFDVSLSFIAEYPSVVRKVFLTQNKNKAGIFALRLFIRGKPYVISVDDNIMFSKSGTPVFGTLSYDGTSAWGMVARKVWAKVNGNYL
jgi:hypothetical protein